MGFQNFIVINLIHPLTKKKTACDVHYITSLIVSSLISSVLYSVSKVSSYLLFPICRQVPHPPPFIIIIIIITIIIKKDWQCKAERGRLTPYQSEDPSPTLPTYRGKEEKGKIVEDKKGACN